MTEWIEYTGSDAQIEEILTAKHGFIVDSQVSIFHKPLPGNYKGLGAEYLRGHFSEYGVTAYLLCNPHPLADMICQWAKTGQPVYWQDKDGQRRGACGTSGLGHYPFYAPEVADYSFTPFED